MLELQTIRFLALKGYTQRQAALAMGYKTSVAISSRLKRLGISYPMLKKSSSMNSVLADILESELNKK